MTLRLDVLGPSRMVTAVMASNVQLQVTVQATADRLAAGLRVVTTVGLPSGQAILSTYGRLRAADGKVLCVLEEPNVLEQEVTISGLAPRGSTTVRVEFFAPLSQRALEHIEEQRRRAVPNDVKFTVEIWGSTIAAVGKPLLTQGETFVREDNGHSYTVVAVDPNQVRGAWALVQDGQNAGFLKCDGFRGSGPADIRSSDWSHHFAPPLGLGTFMVVELPQPPGANGTAFDEAVAAALRDLQDARAKLVSGDDDAAISALRRPAEVIRGRLGEIEDLLRKDGYPSDAAGHYASMIREQVQLCAKFLHSTDKDGKTLRPQVHAKHEDVLFVFSSTVNALNVVTRKGIRHS